MLCSNTAEQIMGGIEGDVRTDKLRGYAQIVTGMPAKRVRGGHYVLTWRVRTYRIYSDMVISMSDAA